MKSYTLDDLARMIDHTNLHTDASPNDMKILCNEAKELLFLSLWDRQQLLLKSLIQKMPLQMGQMRSITL